MAQENVELTYRANEALNRRDSDAFVACLHSDVVWEVTTELLTTELVEIIEASDDRVFAEAVITSRGRASGAETQVRVWFVAWFADGKVTRRQLFSSRNRALEAAGLSE